MYICGTRWCQVSVDEPGPVVAALYVREAAGLTALAAPELPLLDPPSTMWLPWARHPPVGWSMPTLPAGAVERAAGEWEQWWRRLISAEPEMQKAPDPPRFRSFERLPALRSVVAQHFEAAGRWSEAVLDDPRAQAALVSPRPRLNALLEELILDGAKPFRLRLTVVPLASVHAWVVDGSHVLLTRRLVTDPENLLDWLQPRIRRMALGGEMVESLRR